MKDETGKGTFTIGSMEDLNERIAVLETNQANIFHQLDEIKKTQMEIHKLTTSVELLAEKMNTVSETTGNIDRRLNAIEQEPRENTKWLRRTIVGCIVSGIGGAVISFLINFFTLPR